MSLLLRHWSRVYRAKIWYIIYKWLAAHLQFITSIHFQDNLCYIIRPIYEQYTQHTSCDMSPSRCDFMCERLLLSLKNWFLKYLGAKSVSSERTIFSLITHEMRSDYVENFKKWITSSTKTIYNGAILQRQRENAFFSL